MENMVFNKISSIKSVLNRDENPLVNTYGWTTYQKYLELNSIYSELKEKELDEKERFIINASIFILYKYCFEFYDFYDIADEDDEKKDGNSISHSNIGFNNKLDLEKSLENFIKTNFPKIDVGKNYDISINAIFEALEKLNWNVTDDEYDYENQKWKALKNEIRPIFLFYFYRTDENFDKCFWKDLSNLLVNEFVVSGAKNFWGEPVERKYLKDYEFLDERFDKNECLELIKLVKEHNDKGGLCFSLLEKNEYIKNIDVLEKTLECFFQNSASLEYNHGVIHVKKYHAENYEKLFETLFPQLDENPGFYALLLQFMGNLSYAGLEKSFPSKNKKTWRDDVNIYLEIEEEDKEKGVDKQESWYSANFKAYLPLQSVLHDVSKNTENLSNERTVLLRKFFFFAVYKFIYEPNLPWFEDEKEEKEWLKIKCVFLSFCKNGDWKTEECLKNLLNRLAKFCKIEKENPFSKINFSALNKSSHFNSNHALFVSFFNLIRFSKVGKIATLNQLDFINTYQQKLIPISKYYRPDENSKKLKELDCGFGKSLFQQMPIDGVYYERPMKFKIWQDSDREFCDFEKLKKEERKFKDKEIKRKINSNNLTCHYFYSIDRNMITHFSIHKSIENILKDSEKLIYALEDIKTYFENLEEDFKQNRYFRYLRKKFDKIYTIIFAERSGALTDENGKVQSDFNLKEEFGEDFYNSVQEFFEIMYVSDDNLINDAAFGLWIYMLYLTFSLASEDAKNTTEEILEFEISESKLERAKSFFEEDFDRDTIAYYLFFYQLKNILHSKNMKQWESLPVSVIIKLHNGDFDSVPKYVKKMNGVMEDAKSILEYKKQSEKNNNFSENAIAEWKETAKDSGFYKRLSDVSFGDNNDSYSFVRDAVSVDEKIITVNGIRQKVYSKKYRNFKIELSAVLNEDTDEFEIYLGKKISASQNPLFSFTRFRSSFGLSGRGRYGSNKIIPALKIFNGIEIDKTISNLIDCFIKNFADDYFSKCSFTESEASITLEELSEKIMHSDRLSELYEKERFSVCSNFRKGDEYEESFINLSISGYSISGYYIKFEFRLILSDDKKRIFFFKDMKYGTSFSEHEPLFTIPVSAYETLFDFAPEFLKALSDEKNEINYDSDIPEMQEIKKAHSEYLQNEFKKNLEEHKTYIFERENERNSMCLSPSKNDEKKQLENEFAKNFADDYFSKCRFTESGTSITLEDLYELCNIITEFEKNRKDEIKIEADKIWKERKSKNDYELHNDRLSELYEKGRLSVSIDFPTYSAGIGEEIYYTNLSISGYSIKFGFQIILSEDKKSILFFKGVNYGTSFSEHEPIFTIPVSAYETFFDFAPEFLKAFSIELEFDYLEKKVKEEVSNILENKYSALRNLQLNIDEMEKNGEVVKKDYSFDVEAGKMIDYKYKIEGYKSCITSCYEDDEEKWPQRIENELELIPTDDGSHLDIKLYEYLYGGNVLATVKIPSCQYRKFFDFARKLRNYWEENHASYYVKIEHKRNDNGYEQVWLETKRNDAEIKCVFKKLAAETFDSKYDSSVKFTPLELYKTMKTIEIEKKTPLCFAEKKEINGIKQIAIYTGCELLDFSFSLVPVRSCTEIEVYFDTKKSESDKPLFTVESSSFYDNPVIKLLGEMVYNQLSLISQV